MIRKLNFTGRKRIPSDYFDFKLVSRGSGPLAFHAELRLSELGLPSHTRVFVEAYHGAASMRFDFGTVRRIVRPENTILQELPTREVVHFRVKAVDDREKTGLILAEADRITASVGERRSLLYVEQKPLGDELWRLCLDDPWPKLEVNSQVDRVDMLDTVRSDQQFRSLVLPAVLKEILTYILYDLKEIDVDTPDEWGAYWLRYVQTLPGVTSQPVGEDAEDSERDAWIDEATKAFCTVRSIAHRYGAARLAEAT